MWGESDKVNIGIVSKIFAAKLQKFNLIQSFYTIFLFKIAKIYIMTAPRNLPLYRRGD